MRRRSTLRWWLLLLAVCVSGASAWSAFARDITVESAHDKIVNDMFLIDIDAKFAFSDDAIKAINSGIPLTIALDVKVLWPRKYLWDVELVSTHRDLTIERHALSQQFVLSDRVTGERRVYGSLALAIADLGHIRDLPVVEIAELAQTKTCDVSVRLRLDLQSLPGPLIPIAYISPGWHMSSGWYRWQTHR